MRIKNEIPLTIYFELGKTKKTIRDLLNVSKGTYMRLEDSKMDVVKIIVEKKEIGEGKILIQGGKMFVEITELIDEE